MRPAVIGCVVMLLLTSCATSARVAVPAKDPALEGPRLTVRNLFELDQAGALARAVRPQAGTYYTQVGKTYQLIGEVQGATSGVVQLHRRYEWWTRTATTDGLLIAFDYADDLRHIPECCTSIWGTWVPERETSALYYLKIVLWVIDARGRASNSVSLAPIAVGTRGVPYVWP